MKDWQPWLPWAVALRHDLHRQPELGLETVETAARIRAELERLQIDCQPVGCNSVLGVLPGKSSAASKNKGLLLRADMDALPIEEENTLPYCSQIRGSMHACGHDGHSASLLLAAARLAKERSWHGTVFLLFQSGEEGCGGAERVVADGLFDRFSIDTVFGLHNWPGLAFGQFAVHNGPCMAAHDIFQFHITGRGGHAALPHLSCEPFAATADIIRGVQAIQTRELAAGHTTSIAVAQVHGGSAHNVIPERVSLEGCVRSFAPKVQDVVEHRLQALAAGVGQCYGLKVELDYCRRHPAVVNSLPGVAAQAATSVAGQQGVFRDIAPTMVSEDFAFYLQQRPGCFAWLGAGEQATPLHHPQYNFDDRLLPLAADYFVSLATEQLV